ncbi:hypothetical protein YC2023_055707 [Brassica napus]
MLAAAVIGLGYAVVQLVFTISQFATGTIHPFNYLFSFYGDKIISYLLATGSAAGFGVSKDLKDTYLALIDFDSTDPVDNFFSKGYASASLLLFAFVSLAVLSVFSSLVLSKRPIQASTPRSGVRIPDYAIYCRIQEIQVSSPGKSDLLLQTTEKRLTRDLQHGASKSSQTWIFIGRLR